MQRRSKNHIVVHTGSFETHWNLMIWSTEWQFQISMHSAWNRNDPRHDKITCRIWWRLLWSTDQVQFLPQRSKVVYIRIIYSSLSIWMWRHADDLRNSVPIVRVQWDPRIKYTVSVPVALKSVSDKAALHLPQALSAFLSFHQSYCLQLLVPSIVNCHSSGVVN
jgi:hypothetical protein